MTKDHSLHFTRQINARPQAVWRCWTEPALLKQWFAPAPVVTTEAEIDPQPGGGFRTVMEVPDHGTMAGDPGCVLLAEPAARLVWTNALGPGFVPNLIGTGPMDFAFTAAFIAIARSLWKGRQDLLPWGTSFLVVAGLAGSGLVAVSWSLVLGGLAGAAAAALRSDG